MDRRTFITTTGAATLATATAASAATNKTTHNTHETNRAASAHAAKKELRVSMSSPEGVSGEADIARQLCLDITRATENRFSFTFEKSRSGSIDAFSNSDAHIHFGAEHLNTRHHPSVAYFAGLPWHSGLTPENFDAWLSNTSGQDLWDEVMAPFNIKPLLAGHTGTSPGLWSHKPIARLSDLKKKKIAVGGITRDVVRAIGGVAVDFQHDNEAVARFKDRHIDAIELGGPQISMTAGLHTHASTVTIPGFNPNGHNLVFSVRYNVWETLTKTDQTIISSCAAKAFRQSLTQARAQDSIIRRALKNHHNISFHNFAAEVERGLNRVADAVIAVLPGQDRHTQRVNLSYMAYKNTMSV